MKTAVRAHRVPLSHAEAMTVALNGSHGIAHPGSGVERAWLDLDALADVEVTSENAAHPVESALLSGRRAGWRAAAPGRQTIRLLFTRPQRLRRIFLKFVESHSPGW
jgi:hypothetical protein